LLSNNVFTCFLITAGIVLSATLGGCGGGAESKTAVDGTTITADSPSVSNIYIAGSASSNKQSTLSFTVTKKGAPQASIGVTVSLNAQAEAAGVTFFGGGTTLSLITDSSGKTPVFSIVAGSLPTNVIVKGALSNNTTVADYSTAISVSSGNAVQNRFNLAIEIGKSSTESWSLVTMVGISASVADRLGNTVPDGTLINFSASPGGTVIGTASGVSSACRTVSSQCSVTIALNRGTNTNPYVTIVAFTQGEEDFTDANGNNKYDLNEFFVDLGNFYRDDTVNGVYDSGIGQDQLMLTTRSGSTSCPTFPLSLLNINGTCNGVWDGDNTIRTQTRLYMAESTLAASNFNYSGGVLTFNVAGRTNGGRAPDNTSIAVTIASPIPAAPDPHSTCTVGGTVSGSPISSGTASPSLPSTHTVGIAPSCSTLQIEVKLTTPSGTVSTSYYTIP
jgi:hypothetical protein